MELRVLVTLLIGAYFMLTLPGACSSSEEDAFHCNITSNETDCRVPYNSSMLVLHCPGNELVKWRHMLRGQTFPICSGFDNNTCIVRGFEGRLTNDDSGEYKCIESESRSKKAVVTILAPPQLTNIWNDPTLGFCTPDVVRNSCIATNQYYKVNKSFNLTVTFHSVTPTSVRWFFNNSEIVCPSKEDPGIHNTCLRNFTTQNSSVIKILGSKPYSVGGDYTAVVTNAYGSNESIISVYLQDDPVTPTHSRNYLLLEVILPSGVVLLVVIILVLIIARLGRKYRASLRALASKRRRRERAEAERSFLIQEEGTGVREPAGRRPLRPNYQRRYPQYGSTDTSDHCSDSGGFTERQPEWSGDDLQTVGVLIT